MPEISIIVPIYKAANTLHYCIDSILKQTYNDFELILVDDGSPDKSGKICDDYARMDNRIKVIHKSNGGVSNARNIGIDNAHGKYICFVDSDDYADENYLETLIVAKQKYSQYDNIWCYFNIVQNYHFCSQINQNISVEKYNKKEIMTLHEKWLDAGPVCKLYNREIIKNNGIKFNENISLGEDLIFNFQYLDCTNGNILVIDKKTYNYVKSNADSLSQKYYNNMFDIYKYINLIMKHYLDKWNCDNEQYTKYYNACFYKYEVVLQNTFNVNNKASNKDKIKFNNLIMKSKEFKIALKKSNCFIHPLYRFAYNSGNYRTVIFIEKLINLK